MNNVLAIILGTVAIYLALFTHVAFSPKISRSLIAFAAGFSVVVGLIFYGICYASVEENVILAILDTCQAVLQLFLGKAEAVSGAPIMDYMFMKILFSALGFFGVFATTGAALSAIGTKFLRSVQLYFQRNKTLAIVHPLNTNTLDFAKKLTTEKKCVAVFVDKAPQSNLIQAVTELGCVVRSDKNALELNASFLRSIGARHGSRRICLYALSSDRFANRELAKNFLAASQEVHIPTDRTSLTIFAEEDETENAFSAEAGGFGAVLCVNEEYMAARLLLKKAPLYETISFDENGKATEDFHALVVGSGNAGQAVIKQIVMNGQFSGSHFSMAVFDPEFDAITGRMRYECSQLFSQYDIQVYDADARSSRMYGYLNENWQKLKYIVVCTGKDETNREVCRQLAHFLAMHHKQIPLYICSSRGLQKITHNKIQRWDIFTPYVLCTDHMDQMAQLLNQAYCQGNGKTARENWADCDYFSRMSSRASADYAPAFLKMAGLPADAIPEGEWLTPQQLENMAISEHDRWCAFYYCMGFRAMTREEFQERCQIYTAEKAKDPNTRYRIGKDLSARIHCCLIPWSELDDLSARENAVTGKNTDYKQMDRNNVLMLPELLKSAKE